MNDKTLVQRLRALKWQVLCEMRGLVDDTTAYEAADTIEAQATRIEALERLVHHYVDVSDVRQDDEAFLLEIVRRLSNESTAGQPWLRTYDAHLKE